MEQLSPHFSFEELTVTRNASLQEKNRIEAQAFKNSLKSLAITLLEPIRHDRPLVVKSAFRCPDLNGATPGSSKTSQHMKGEAADIHREGQSIDDLFQEIRMFLKINGVSFGQLIKEEAQRDYGVVQWVHISLGEGYREPSKCGQILIMKNGIYTEA